MEKGWVYRITFSNEPVRYYRLKGLSELSVDDTAALFFSGVSSPLNRLSLHIFRISGQKYMEDNLLTFIQQSSQLLHLDIRIRTS